MCRLACTGSLTTSVRRDSLTDAERRVADLVAQGLSNRQVANRVSS
jgi:DNA-binding CsgD family transcriptional regulator